MKQAYNDVLRFHEAFKCHIGEKPQLLNEALTGLRQKLLWDEFQEYLIACQKNDLTAIFDGLLDIIYVAIGTGISYGLPMIEGWQEVQRSNMAKLSPEGKAIRREDGKILKPEGWQPPQLAELIS